MAYSEDIASIQSRIAALESSFSSIESKMPGNGAIVNHGNRFDVDRTISISALLKKIGTTSEDSIAAHLSAFNHSYLAEGHTAFGWGDHSLAGYSHTGHTHAWTDITSGVPTSFTPSAHATTHQHGGSDTVKLYELYKSDLSDVSFSSDVSGNCTGVGNITASKAGDVALILDNAGTNGHQWKLISENACSCMAGQFAIYDASAPGYRLTISAAGVVRIPNLTAGYVKADASGYLSSSANVAWADISGAPGSYTPSAHASSHLGSGSDALLPTAASGWLKNNGANVLSWSTPTAVQVGADPAGTADAIIINHLASYEHEYLAEGHAAYGWGNHAAAGYAAGNHTHVSLANSLTITDSGNVNTGLVVNATSGYSSFLRLQVNSVNKWAITSNSPNYNLEIYNGVSSIFSIAASDSAIRIFNLNNAGYVKAGVGGLLTGVTKVPWTDLDNVPSSLSGYGIEDQIALYAGTRNAGNLPLWDLNTAEALSTSWVWCDAAYRTGIGYTSTPTLSEALQVAGNGLLTRAGDTYLKIKNTSTWGREWWIGSYASTCLDTAFHIVDHTDSDAVRLVIDRNGDVNILQKIWVGSPKDTNLYRSAANTLKTDDSFDVAGAHLRITGTNKLLFGDDDTLGIYRATVASVDHIKFDNPIIVGTYPSSYVTIHENNVAASGGFSSDNSNFWVLGVPASATVTPNGYTLTVTIAGYTYSWNVYSP